MNRRDIEKPQGELQPTSIWYKIKNRVTADTCIKLMNI